MDSRSKDTLLAVEQNSDELTSLEIGAHHLSSDEGVFNTRDSGDYDKLGTAIGNNNHLKILHVSNLYNNVTLNTLNKRFYDGIRHNASITELYLNCITINRSQNTIRYNCVHDIDDGDCNNIFDVALEILKACQEKNILTKLHIHTMPLVGSGEQIMADILRGFTNLRQLTFVYSELTDDQLLPMVEAIRGYTLIEMLEIAHNNIGDTGCEALATLRNVRSLCIAANRNMSNEGLISIVNSLSENKNLRELNFNRDNLRALEDDFSRALCNTSSINDIYLSNHTLESVSKKSVIEFFLDDVLPGRVASLLEMNKKTNKRHVAIEKILLHHPPIDMEPLFDLSLEEDDSGQDLKALPHVISWFETAAEAIIEDNKLSANDLEIKKISAIYQFVTAMPMLFIPASHHDKGVEYQME